MEVLFYNTLNGREGFMGGTIGCGLGWHTTISPLQKRPLPVAEPVAARG